MVVGRKGSGKTAIFYALRNSFGSGHGNLVLDLKPEGHQFLKLREAVLDTLSPGVQAHTLVAFWNYILLCEIAQKVADYDYSWAQRDQERRKDFSSLVGLYQETGPADQGDMSERLLYSVDRLVDRLKNQWDGKGAVTHALFGDEIHRLSEAAGAYLKHKEEVWILVDNLDKAWPIRGATSVDILIVRALLDAARKLQRQLAQDDVELKVIVFLRNDIRDHLIRETPDKGKDTAIALDWNDSEVFKELVARRIVSTTSLRGSFDEVWSALFDIYVGTTPALSYMLERTLMRPRDLLAFLNKAVEVAINRGHSRVTQEDMVAAEGDYSADLLYSLSFELNDINVDYGDVLYEFVGAPSSLTRGALEKKLMNVGLL